MLEVRDLDAFYGPSQALRGASLTVALGQVVCLFGRNGAGKSTLLKAIMGLVRTAGAITLDGADIRTLAPHEIPKRGVGYAPQGRRLFGEMTVAENLEVGLMARGRGAETREAVLTRFPRLRERLSQRAGALSGGEQQMLAIGRALCLEPSVLLLDEPTEGLQPSMVAEIRDVVAALRDEGAGVLLVEQRIDAVAALADTVVFLENGRVVKTTDGDALRADPELAARYVGA